VSASGALRRGYRVIVEWLFWAAHVDAPLAAQRALSGLSELLQRYPPASFLSLETHVAFTKLKYRKGTRHKPTPEATMKAIMDPMQAIFPYGMEMDDDGLWTFFNRSYKPVGMNTNEFIDYKDHPVRFKLKGLGPATRDKLDVRGKGTDRQIFFYDDATRPTISADTMKAYLKRLKIIMRLRVA